MTAEVTSTQVHRPHPEHVVGTSLLYPHSRGFPGGVWTSGFVAAHAGQIRGYFDEPGLTTRCTVILSGSCSMSAGGKTYSFATSDLILANTSPESFTFENSAEFSALEIHIPTRLLDQMSMATPSGLAVRSVGVQDPVLRTARQLFSSLLVASRASFKTTPADALVGYGLAMTVVGYAFAQDKEHATRWTENTAEGLNAAKQALLARFDHAPTINQLAALSGMSLTRFKELFRERFGCAPFALYQAHRMERACQLLQDHNVTETAMELGYSNVSHFSAAFQRQYGCSPGQWQRLMRLKSKP